MMAHRLEARGLTWQVVAALPPLVLLVAAAALWLSIVYGMRVRELEYRLRSNNDQQQSVRTLSLITRYKLLRQKAGERDGAQNFGREGRLMQALTHTVTADLSPALGIGESTALWTIEFFNIVAASPRFVYEQNSPNLRKLEQAFFHELRRSYGEAIALYDDVLGRSSVLPGDLNAYAQLHRGFCFALANDRSAALRDFAAVAAAHKGEYAQTATALTAMVREIDEELGLVDSMALSAEKGTAYYRLTAYDKAISTLTSLNNLKGNPSGLFYLGRSHEERGNNAAAAETYRRLISLHARSDWATKANRRLFAMGAFYTAGTEYREESKSNVRKRIVDDQGLLVEAKRFEEVALHLEALQAQQAVATGRALTTVVRPQQTTQPTVTAPAPQAESSPPAPRELGQKQQRTPARAPRETAGKQDTPVAVSSTPATAATEHISSAIELAKTWEQKEKLSRKDKSAWLRQQKNLLRITLSDGNQFTGVVISETEESIFLFTVIGKISVDKSQMIARERL